MQSMSVMVCGPMEGHTDWNYPAFFDAASKIRAAGHHALNPAEINGSSLQSAVQNARVFQHVRSYYLTHSAKMAASADALCLLPGWRESQGASMEVAIAKALGTPLMRLDQHGHLVPLYEIVGVSGYARAGKDTLAHVLCESHGFRRVAWADSLRAVLYATDPCITSAHMSLRELVDGFGWEYAKTEYPEVRGLLQRLGTEGGRTHIADDVWVRTVLDSLTDGDKVVIPDTRFPNEFAAIKAQGGQVWRIERADITAVNAHVSETALDGAAFDRVFANDGTIADLRRAVSEVFTQPVLSAVS